MTRLAQLPPPVRAAIAGGLLVDGYHQCPGCGETVSPGHVGCRTCWLRVPRHHRTRLGRAFRDRTRDFSAFTRAQQEAADLIRQHTPQEQP